MTLNDPHKSIDAGITEKQRRVYYQDIVYHVCNALDKAFPGKTVCGTVEQPSDEVQQRIDSLVSFWEVQQIRIADLQLENERLRRNYININP